MGREAMTPALAYWTWAFLNMLVALAVALSGVRRARRRDFGAHRMRMRAAAMLVVLFVVSYPVKLLLLGREPIDTWESQHVWILRVHELCVAVMLIGGAVALRMGGRIGVAPGSARAEAGGDGAEGSEAARRLHRGFGRAAVIAGVLGVATAFYVLGGMYERAQSPRAEKARRVSEEASRAPNARSGSESVGISVP